MSGIGLVVAFSLIFYGNASGQLAQARVAHSDSAVETSSSADGSLIASGR